MTERKLAIDIISDMLPQSVGVYVTYGDNRYELSGLLKTLIRATIEQRPEEVTAYDFVKYAKEWHFTVSDLHKIADDIIKKYPNGLIIKPDAPTDSTRTPNSEKGG